MNGTSPPESAAVPAPSPGSSAAASVVLGYAVVLFGDANEDWCGLSNCPLGSAQLFPDQDAARAYAASVPAGFEPHLILIESADCASARAPDRA
jgi:hypothetical protein